MKNLILSHAAETRLVLLDAAAIAVADAGVEISPSQQAAVQMDTAPVDGAASLMSLWQTHSMGLRSIRYVHWVKGYADAVEYIELEVGSPS